MENMIDNFCKLALHYNDKRLDVLLNAYIKSKKNKEEIDWISNNYIMFIRAAECIRNADNDMLGYIMKKNTGQRATDL